MMQAGVLGLWPSNGILVIAVGVPKLLGPEAPNEGRQCPGIKAPQAEPHPRIFTVCPLFPSPPGARCTHGSPLTGASP